MKHFIALLASDILISLLYSIIRGFSEFSFINCLFFIGMIYFLAGILCYVWEKGFFNITLFSFNKINQQIQKKRGVLPDEPDITLEDYIDKVNYFYLTNSLLTCGGLITISSIFISFILL
ncbi:MAG: DUF3899 domain-containing protein [Peptostreptococcaceae bacterium]